MLEDLKKGYLVMKHSPNTKQPHLKFVYLSEDSRFLCWKTPDQDDEKILELSKISNVIIESKGKKVSFKKSALVRVPIRLGADTFILGKISDTNNERMIKAMNAFKLLMEVHGVKKHYACATSAMREAENGEFIAEKIEKETGIKINIIDGKKEAAIIGFVIFNPFRMVCGISIRLIIKRR